jgi:hypothetical protein
MELSTGESSYDPTPADLASGAVENAFNRLQEIFGLQLNWEAWLLIHSARTKADKNHMWTTAGVEIDALQREVETDISDERAVKSCYLPSAWRRSWSRTNI